MEEKAGLCRRDLDHLDRNGGSPAEAAGLIHQGGGAAGTGEGDHQKRCTKRESGCQIEGALKHLAITDRASGAAVLLPGRGAGHLRPAELIGRQCNGLIGAAGIAMKERLDQAATRGAE